MPHPDLRPMNFGEILDASLVIYRRHFGLFLKLAIAALAVPVALSAYFVLRLVADLQEAPFRTLAMLVPVLLLYYIASLVMTAGTVRIIADSYLGRIPQLRDAFSLGVSKIWPLVAVGLGKGVVLMLIIVATAVMAFIAVPVLRGTPAIAALLVFALVVAGTWLTVYVACGYGVTTPVVVLEELRSSFDAFGRSWDLTRGFKGKVLGLAIVAFLLCDTIPRQIFQTLAGALMPSSPGLGIALTVVSVAVPLVLAPVIASVITLMYYDLRVRREAFDLQVLGQQLGII